MPSFRKFPAACSRSELRSARSRRGESLGQDFDRLVDVRLGDVQGRRDAEGISFEASLADEQTPFLRLLEYTARQRLLGSAIPRGLVHDELDAQHQPLAAHVSDVLRKPALDTEETFAQNRAHLF